VFGTLHANRQDFTGHSDGTRAERYDVFHITSNNLRTFYQFDPKLLRIVFSCKWRFVAITFPC
jgi:hypothetical protein